MQGRNGQTLHRLLSRWQFQSSEALVTHQACLSSPAVQRLSSTASQTAPAQPQAAEPQSGDSRVAQLTYSQNVRDLRRKWQEQRAQKLAAKAKADAIKDANKAKSVEAHRRNLSAIKEVRMQIHEEKRRLQMAELVRQFTSPDAVRVCLSAACVCQALVLHVLYDALRPATAVLALISYLGTCMLQSTIVAVMQPSYWEQMLCSMPCVIW